MKKAIIAVAIIAIVGCGLFSTRVESKPSTWGQETPARCQISVPKAWGEFVDSGSYGLAFRDAEGTIRFVNQFPCGLEGDPQVSLAVRRK